LGWDVLCADYADFHSWFCNGIDHVDAVGVGFNAHGFVDSFDDAQRVADYCNVPENGAEPGYWAPWRITRYPL
jgi:hypothetical protein